MPLPLVHLSVAHSLMDTSSLSFDHISPPGLYLGAISPDAIHTREGWTREDKRRIHVFGKAKELPARLHLIDGLIVDLGKTTEKSFLCGWISHIVTDALWSHYVVHGAWDAYSSMMSDETRRETYYRENDKIEYRLYHDVPWRPSVWSDLSHAQPQAVEQLLSADEIDAWRNRYLRWHAEIGKEPEDDPGFFTLDLTESFIELAILVCRTGFETTFANTVDTVVSQYPQDYIGILGNNLE